MTNTAKSEPADLHTVGVVLVAAGSGTRFGGKKQFLELDGSPLLLHVIRLFTQLPEVAEISVVVPAADIDRTLELVNASNLSPPSIAVVPGGARRQDSVLHGLRSLGASSRWALVHDAARPMVRVEDLGRFIAVLRERGAAVLGYPSSDSVKEERDGTAIRDLSRDHVWLVQTPQGAVTSTLVTALEEADRRGLAVTDETAALELIDERVALVEGPRDNIKITFKEDLELAEFLLQRRRDQKTP